MHPAFPSPIPFKMKKSLYLIVSVFILLGCKPEIEVEDWSTGNVDVSRYVAIGGSATAGYMDDALYFEGQSNSFAAIIATQLGKVSTCEHTIPYVGSSSVGSNLAGLARLVMGYKTDCNNESSLSPIRYSAIGDESILTNWVGGSGGFHNWGVPGLSTIQIHNFELGQSWQPAYNPFYARMSSNPGATSLRLDAMALNPTFFTVQLGEDDILNYAVSGATAPPPAPTIGLPGVGFDGSLNMMLGNLAVTGAEGIVANIPDVTQFPYFTTIPYDGLELDAANAATLNQVFNPLNIYFLEGANGFTIDDPTQPFGVRKMVEGELILLSVPLDSIKCYGMGSIHPIPNKYVLTLAEIAAIRQITSEYNASIENAAANYGFGLADVASLYTSLNSGIVYNGVSMTAIFVSGGAFSLDGRQLNPRGQAMLANVYIKSINTTYGARIPLADPTDYRGIKFP